MRKLAILALFIILAAAVEVTEDEGVAVLTEKNFDEFIAQHEFVLVEFYAPWCGHCKKLKPEYERAAATLKGLEKPVPLAKVDATENQELASKFGVQGYPTIKFFTNGQPIEFNGGRTDKEIVNWIQKKVGHVSTELKDQAAFDKFTGANSVAVVYFGQSESDSNWAIFKSAALSNDKLAFAHSFSSELAAAQNAKSGSLVIFKKFDEKRNDFEGTFDLSSIKAWLDAKSFATVMEFDDRAIEKVFQQGNPTIFLFHTKTEASTKARAEFEAAAKELKGGKVIFSVSHPDDGHGHFNRLAEYLGVNLGAGNSEVPKIMLIHASNEVAKFAYSGDYSAASVRQFVEDFNNNKLSRFLKSEEIPTKQEGPVKVLVGKSYQAEVIDNTKDVLVKFYAPWCGHCKTLAPIWEEAAKELAGNPNVVIAKLDATLNEVEGVNIKGFPTLKFYPGNNKGSPIDFEGERTKEGIINWLKEKSTNPWVTESADAAGNKKNDDL